MLNRLFLICLVGFAVACDSEQRKVERYSQQQFKDSLIEVNKTLMNSEDHLIDQFLKRKQWNVTSTGTGLRYIIYKEGKGQNLAQPGQYATIAYKVSLLNGKVCYQSKPGDYKEFLIERDNVESGLHEGVKYMKVGDKAKLIMPSHLAHGLLGDMSKIPPRAPIVYDIELLRLK